MYWCKSAKSCKIVYKRDELRTLPSAKHTICFISGNKTTNAIFQSHRSLRRASKVKLFWEVKAINLPLSAIYTQKNCYVKKTIIVNYLTLANFNFNCNSNWILRDSWTKILILNSPFGAFENFASHFHLESTQNKGFTLVRGSPRINDFVLNNTVMSPARVKFPMNTVLNKIKKWPIPIAKSWGIWVSTKKLQDALNFQFGEVIVLSMVLSRFPKWIQNSLKKTNKNFSMDKNYFKMGR